MHKILLSVGLVLCFLGAFLVFRNDPVQETAIPPDHKNISYIVGGKEVLLVDGVGETEVAPGSASKTVTRYFGNEFNTDLDGDGRIDVVFLITQETGGSGLFFYAVAALNTPEGYRGSDGYFLGDRIAPQTIDLSTMPRHDRVISVNYAVRAPGESMTTAPSVGKSAFLKLDAERMQWGVVEPDFEGESR